MELSTTKTLLLILFILQSFGLYSQSEEFSELDKIIKSNNIIVEISRIIPIKGNNIETTDGYTMQLKKDTLSCYLPYFGQSDGIGYGGRDLSIEIDKSPIEIIDPFTFEKDHYIIRFTATSLSNEKWKFSIKMYSNKRVYINVTTSQRSPISYQGFIQEK